MKSYLWIILVCSITLGGCGKDEDSVAKGAGAKVGEGLTDFFHGVGEGVDKRMTVDVELSSELQASGLSKTIAKSVGVDDGKGISVYLLSQKPFKGTLMAKAFDADQQEIGRSFLETELGGDDAKYVVFKFDRDLDTKLVKTYRIARKTQ